MNINDIKSKVKESLDTLYKRDMYLIENSMEWSSAHRLAVYLEKSLGSDWDVDCEYTRMGPYSLTKHNSEGQYKRPDIIVHKRKRIEIENNLLVIELKMNDSTEADVDKLISFTSPPNHHQEFQYRYGLSLKLLRGGPEMSWFSKGSLIQCYE